MTMRDQVVKLACNLDDMTGEDLGGLIQALLDEGALDAWFTPIQMKKARPGVMVSVLCRPSDGERLATTLLAKTSTLGVRYETIERRIADRAVVSVETPWGSVGCKLKVLDGLVVGLKAEQDDCRRLAVAAGGGLTPRQVKLAAETRASEWLGHPPLAENS